MRISEDIVPVDDFEAEPSAWLDRAKRTGQPVILTRDGRAAGVLLSPAAFDALAERARFVSAVEEGLEDAEAGRVHDHAAVVLAMKQRRQTRTPKKG
jgi:prevent-host-death family protein